MLIVSEHRMTLRDVVDYLEFLIMKITDAELSSLLIS
jgi:hypothetical protein